ncbi:MAG: serine/threonine-protein kinase [Pseudomonadota bacterium]
MAVRRKSIVGEMQEASDDTLKPGATLLQGQYRIIDHLNSGGFGITYLARDSLDRKVVVKECFPNMMCAREGTDVVARSKEMTKELTAVVRHFVGEARRMSVLEHPNIVGVHQVFQDNNTAYMALDFVQGCDLLNLIDDTGTQLSPEAVKSMLVKLLQAIQYVHDNDVLHRDISPDNVLVNENNDPVLIDFGAAREVATNASRMLSALHVVKDGYSPQEFYLGNNSQSPASDLYSLAATFYHVITGSPPPNSQVRLAALASEEPDPCRPISNGIEGYDQYFIEALNRAMSVFPKDRLQSATEWMEEIDQAQRQRALRERALRDQSLDLVIRELTIATNAEMMATEEEAPREEVPEPVAEPVKEKSKFALDWDDDDDALWDEAPDDELDPEHDDEDADAEAVEAEAPRRKQSLLLRVVLSPMRLLGAKSRRYENSGAEQ